MTGPLCKSSFIAGAFLLMPFFVCAAGIDDIVNYQPQPTQTAPKGAQPYTLQDVINNLPNALDDSGVYKGITRRDGWGRDGWIDPNDPRALAFDEANFGECEEFYIHSDRNQFGKHNANNYGALVFFSTLEYMFPANEIAKADASKMVKNNLAQLENKRNNFYTTETEQRCPNLDDYAVRLKEILNTVIQAAPAILVEKQRMVEIAQEANRRKQNQEIEIAKAKEQADEKAKGDRQAIEIAELKGREERANRLKACEATNAYKLYKSSAAIEYNQSLANNAHHAIQRQEEGAKISGYVDKAVMYKMGNVIVEANRLNKENFEGYKQLGGAARKIEAVKSLPNPCDM